MKKKKIKVLRTHDEIFEFLSDHNGEIDGLYKDKYWRNGGWNGLMDAIGEVEERYGASVEPGEGVDFEALINGGWRK